MLDRFLEIVILKGLLGLLSYSENENWKYLSLAASNALTLRCSIHDLGSL